MRLEDYSLRGNFAAGLTAYAIVSTYEILARPKNSIVKKVKIMRTLCCTLAEYLQLKGRGLVCPWMHLWVLMTALLRARDILLALINTVYFFNLNTSVWRRRPVMWTPRNGHRTLALMMGFRPRVPELDLAEGSARASPPVCYPDRCNVAELATG